ncbi:hypothetical protein VTI28DRAFT_3326 [Corynascus sepedonium]
MVKLSFCGGSFWIGVCRGTLSGINSSKGTLGHQRKFAAGHKFKAGWRILDLRNAFHDLLASPAPAVPLVGLRWKIRILEIGRKKFQRAASRTRERRQGDPATVETCGTSHRRQMEVLGDWPMPTVASWKPSESWLRLWDYVRMHQRAGLRLVVRERTVGAESRLSPEDISSMQGRSS